MKGTAVQIDAAALVIVRIQNVLRTRILRVVNTKGPFTLSLSLNAVAPYQFGVATHFRVTSRNLATSLGTSHTCY